MSAVMDSEILVGHIRRLRGDYLTKLKQELADLEQWVSGLAADPALAAEVCLRLHRIAGTAGTFGLTELGARARLLELKISAGSPFDTDVLVQSTRKLSEYASAQSELSQEEAPVLQDQSVLIEGVADLRVLIAGDDIEYCRLLASVLQKSCHVEQVHCGAETLAVYERNDADILLLDVGLPDMSGYDVCRSLERIRPREWRSVVLVSAHNRMEDKLAAYDAGGDDYFTKPIQLSEFVAKMKTLATYTKSKKDLLSQNQQARKLAFDSMAEVALYGRVVDLMRNLMGCHDHAALAEQFFASMDALGLKVSLRYSEPVLRCFSAPGQVCSPIELNLFEVLAHSGRLQHHGKRTLVNGRYVGFLVKNMPVEDEIAYGRLKDLVAVIVEALDASFVAIARQQALSCAVGDLNALTKRITSQIFAENSPVQESVQRLETLMKQLESSFDFLDLNADQERFLYGVLHQGVLDVTSVVEALAGMRDELTEINHNLLRYGA